jgi:hypothetical protein
MRTRSPEARLDPGFSSPDAVASSWLDVQRVLSDSGIYWISTVRPDGQANVSSIAGVWLDGAFHFCTGPGEQKSANLDRNPQCAITAGNPEFADGMDVVVEGAVSVIDDAEMLGRLQSEFDRKYNGFFGFAVTDGGFYNGGGSFARVYRVVANKVFAFARGSTFSQTRWKY